MALPLLARCGRYYRRRRSQNFCMSVLFQPPFLLSLPPNPLHNVPQGDYRATRLSCLSSLYYLEYVRTLCR